MVSFEPTLRIRMWSANCRFSKPASGQILILVLLIVVVTLAVGLSVASRNLTNLKTSTQTGESQRAFTAAEGGVEDALSQLKSLTSGITAGSSVNLPTQTIGDVKTDVSVKASNVYQSIIEEGFVGQIPLLNTSATGVRIEWALSADAAESAVPASIEVTIIYEPSAGNFIQDRSAWQGLSPASSGKETGFASPNCGSLSGFLKCTQVNFLYSNPRYLRIRPFWNKTTVKVSANPPGATLPVQTYDVESTATTDVGITRKVKVTRTALPQLPAAFDYVLFSNTDIVR